MQRERQNRLEVLLSEYIIHKKDEKKFAKHMEKRASEANKDRTSDSISDNKQQNISKAKWCTWMWDRIRKKKTNNKKKGKTDNENIWNVIKNTV